MERNKSRTSRFDSFELSDSEQQSSSNLKVLVFDLQNFFPSTASEFTEIDRIIEDQKQDDNDGEEFPEIPLYKEKFLIKARKDMRCLETMKGLKFSTGDIFSDGPPCVFLLSFPR